MRDWNSSSTICLTVAADQFVSYLWGIETRPWKPCQSSVSGVCILPMRDWNLVHNGGHNYIKLFVSYLWGIETNSLSPSINSFSYRLYLTYEGLKLIVKNLEYRDWFSLYLTYEGLKLVQKSRKERRQWKRLYLTYEGLKHVNSARRGHIPLRVCILPMRDWNWRRASLRGSGVLCLYLTYEGLKHSSLRNSERRSYHRLYLTYEGLKQNKKIKAFVTPSVCILPMRDWNNHSLIW